VDAEYKKIPNEHLETPRPLDELDELDKLDEVDEDVLLLLEKEEDLDDDDYGEEGGERGKSGKKQEEVVVYKRVGMRRSSVINASQVADVTGVGV